MTVIMLANMIIYSYLVFWSNYYHFTRGNHTIINWIFYGFDGISFKKWLGNN